MDFFPRIFKQINIGFAVAFILLIVGFVLTIFMSTRFTSQSNLISETDSTFNRLSEMLTNLKSAQASLSEYALTKNYQSLEKYYHNRQRIDSLFEEISQFYSASDEQEDRLDTLDKMLSGFFSKDNHESFLKSSGNTSQFIDSLGKNSRRSSLSVDSISNVINTIQGRVQKEEKERKRLLDSLSISLKILGYSMLIVAFFLAVYMLVIYNRERLAKKVARQEADEYYKELEERIVELGQMNKENMRLKSMEKFNSLGRVAAMTAHEIKNPLTNIDLATHQLQDEIVEEDLREYLTIIKRNSNRINSYINNFLNVTASPMLEKRKVSINKLLDEIITEAGDRIKLGGIKIIKNYSGDICDLSIDAGKIKLAFSNIIFNAFDAMEDHKGILTISTEDKENRCVVTISDNGIGMDKETISKIFEPFFTTKKKKGSGLGLMQSQNIILNHDGEIEAESRPGEGTRFIIKLNFPD